MPFAMNSASGNPPCFRIVSHQSPANSRASPKQPADQQGPGGPPGLVVSQEHRAADRESDGRWQELPYRPIAVRPQSRIGVVEQHQPDNG
jgi:hypothetical protein